MDQTASPSLSARLRTLTSPSEGGGRADLGDQGCRDGTMAGTAGGRVSFTMLRRREDGGSSEKQTLWDALVGGENSGEPASSGVWCFGFGLAAGCSCAFQEL